MYVKNMIIAMQNMPNKYNKKIKCNHIEKSIKVPFVIQADLESLLEKQILAIVILKDHQQPKYINIHKYT